ncbi:hypothetical protein [Sphingomonas sp. MMS24-J13]|uniref:hypothetical protein n=1 Tax=Sphingomonas sp. MMS24-J13 TaxID=3238686 RepID=UPI00384D596C
MFTLILFGLGGSVGLTVAIAAGLRTHQQRFNLVSAGILGALFGGLGLARIVRGALPFDGATVLTALLCATLVASAFTAALVVLHRRFVRSPER